MFVNITSVRGGEGAVAISRMAGEAMKSWLRDFEGYGGLIILANEESGLVRILTFWETREDAERSEHSRGQVRESMVAAAAAEVESVDLYELVVHERLM